MTLDELMSRLLQTHEQYTAQLAVEITEEDARAERDAVKREQDLAFQESLKVRSNPNPSPAKPIQVMSSHDTPTTAYQTTSDHT